MYWSWARGHVQVLLLGEDWMSMSFNRNMTGATSGGSRNCLNPSGAPELTPSF